MNERIRELAEQAGDDWEHTLESDKKFLERFAALVAAEERVAAEREACAKAAEKHFEPEVWQRLEKAWLIGYDAGREAEREACAMELERSYHHLDGILELAASTYFIASRVTAYLAARIRARGDK